MDSGFITYKCRRCGKTIRDRHTPNGIITLNAIIEGLPLPRQWGVHQISTIIVHVCDDDNLGVCDLSGFEYDKE